MSTRMTKWLWPGRNAADGWAIHLYSDMDGWVYVDISRGYGFHFRVFPRRWLIRRWLGR